MRVVVVVEGGLVQEVITEENAEVLIVDCDVESADLDDVVRIPDLDMADAVMSEEVPEVNPEKVKSLFGIWRDTRF